MIVNLLIVLLIIIVMCNSVTYNSKYRCPKYTVKIKYVRASRLPGETFSEKVGIDTINLKLDRDVPCGIYSLTNAYGKASLFVGNTDSRTGFMHMKNMDVISKINLFDLWDLQRIESDTNIFIRTYNRGCCD